MKETLLVVWQNVITRQKYHIGTLTFNPHEDIYEFQYNYSSTHRGLEDAIKAGFTGIHEFGITSEVLFSKELFYFFNKRLPNPRRLDYGVLLKRFGLDETSSKLEFLKRTKGKLATDNYELYAPINVEDNNFVLETYIEGWQYYDGNDVLPRLELNESLRLVREPDNRFDKFAVVIGTAEGYKLGYISAVYSNFIANVIDEGMHYEVKISNKYPDAIEQMQIWIEIKGECHFINTSRANCNLGERSLMFC